ncbi:DUF4154 domain-containing protein [Pseudodesulfovibrio cashew]|uniref:DUF4154 domain-containing protein n=1 Tax=Pseudodesulfovibrio cashew TaxID=2678688 RepID=A0A6I6JEQ7_9BACT|nr:YfiR family protein [Pseudodesulfovibrio cashew]QGY39560.1 DUF4154 domain-containing protein [Pseudodesulfovibrio cashew]
MRGIRTLCATLLLGMTLLFPAPAHAGGRRLTASSEQLQALFVQRLVKYVAWPGATGPAPGEPFIVAATDARSLRPYFDSAAGPDHFELVQWPAEKFHVLVVNNAPEREAAAILQREAGRPVLTIGQSAQNLRLGVIVNFRMVGGKIRLQVNPVAAERAGLYISSKLLRIAQIYRENDDE